MISSEQIVLLAEKVNAITKSEFTETVLKRLDSFGYIVKEEDVFLIGFSIQNIEQYVKNECNISVIPDGLISSVVDRVCGEILSAKYGTGQLEIASLDLEGALGAVNVGDVSVSFKNGDSDEEKLTNLISLLTNAGRGEFACYRAIKW